MTIKEFADKHKIEMKSIKIERNPNIVDDRKWKADHYEVTFSRWAPNGANRIEAKLTTYYSMGIGHKGKRPTLEEVLNCLVSDADAMEYAFEVWCDNLGYDTDSRKAFKTYEVCREQAQALISFLGGRTLFNELFECERL